MLIRQSGNAKVAPGGPGYVHGRLAGAQLLEKPTALDRANGDVHPQGNPHVRLDPHRIS